MTSDFDHFFVMRAYDRSLADAEWLKRDTTGGWYRFGACPECRDTVFQQPNGYCHCMNCEWQILPIQEKR